MKHIIIINWKTNRRS